MLLNGWLMLNGPINGRLMVNGKKLMVPSPGIGQCPLKINNSRSFSQDDM